MTQKNLHISNKKTQTDQRTVIKNTLAIFLPITLINIVIILFVLNSRENIEIKLFKQSESTIVDIELKDVNHEIQSVFNDLSILKSNNLIQNFWNNPSEDKVKALSKNFLNIIKHKKVYDQIRLLDTTGQEIIRVNYFEGHPEIINKNELQNKKLRYYFKQILELDNRDFFVSAFDLNIENNHVEYPLKPIIRFGVPLYDKAQNKQGILLLNYLGENILNQFELYSDKDLQSERMLLNKDGYWLKSPTQENEWAFMFPNKKQLKFQNTHPEAWETITQHDTCQFINKEGLFTAKTVYPLKPFGTRNKQLTAIIPKNYDNYYWKIVSFVPSEILLASQANRRYIIAVIFVLFSIGLLYFSYKISLSQHQKKKFSESLKISNTTKDKFFSIIAHDLRGSFHALLSLSDLMMEDIKKGETKELPQYGEMINTTANKTYKLLNNLLEWSRAQSNQVDFNPQQITIFNLVDEVFETVKLQAKEKQISLKNFVSIDAKLVADKNMLSTLIRNVVSNAIKFCNKSGEIQVLATAHNNVIHFEIKDNGVGIKPEVLETLLDLTNTKLTSTDGTNNESGSGLGLILCKEIAVKHHGEIGIISEVNKGTNVWFKLPKNQNKQ